MTAIATMTLIQAGETRCLAGHHIDGQTVFVLRRDDDVYELHQLPITTAQESLRAMLAADQSESNELITAILQTVTGPIRKPRRRKAK